ncbi:WYL domain-containing protein [Streptomyces sp. NBC_01238]|uniref:WYL domain-containing protein n=1 Tax=Streptomyces sp. NBC_01238 TaxID=2903791 RepID=UPI002F915E7A
MRNTNRQTTTRTLADLYRALDRQNAVTITYRKEDGTETVRTIEPYSVRTTTNGSIIVRAMDRETGEARSFRADRIEAYTLHRSAFQIDRPAGDETTANPAPAHSVAALIAYELERDTIAAAYRTRVALAA